MCVCVCVCVCVTHTYTHTHTHTHTYTCMHAHISHDEQWVENSMVSPERILQYADIEGEAVLEECAANIQRADPSWPQRGCVEFVDVVMSYGDKLEPVLRSPPPSNPYLSSSLPPSLPPSLPLSLPCFLSLPPSLSLPLSLPLFLSLSLPPSFCPRALPPRRASQRLRFPCSMIDMHDIPA